MKLNNFPEYFPMFSRLLCLLLLTGTIAVSAQAQERYIEDTVFVPLRTGGSTEHRVVHQGLPSGTAVTVLEEDRELGWSRVRTREGNEGWLPSRYLKREPGARYQVLSALHALGQPEDGSVSLSVAIEQLRKDADEAIATRDALQTELLELRELSNNATTLDANNRTLTETVQMLKNQMSVLEADNARLHDEAWQKWFINGVWATGIGGFLTLVLPRIIPRRKRRSEWG
ncbi:MAG: TIGR04211 family SH3 domain-containing protein [Gammaproteobacteria bacterium]|nr:TIGR04211 family SH3 domain-containing protein [Gammaproteobacteria bacterium]